MVAHPYVGKGGKHGRCNHGQEQRRAVTRALRRHRRQEQPVARRGVAQAFAQELDRHGVDPSDHQGGEQPEQDAPDRQEHETGTLPRSGVVGRLQRRLPGLAKKHHPVELDHHVGSEGGGEHEGRRCQRHQHAKVSVGDIGREQERLEQQPLRHEAVQRGQPGERQGAHQREPGDPRHAMDKPAEAAEAALVGSVQHRTGRRKQQALHHGVIEAVIERGDQGQRRQRRHAMGPEHDREPDGAQHDADVLDGRIREEPLHVGLDRGEHDPEQRRDEADDERDDAPRARLSVQQVEGDSQEPVDRGLQHHPTHQGRDGRRGRGVGFRQPRMQRQEPGLGAEADEREAERNTGPGRCNGYPAHRIEGERAGLPLQNPETHEQRDGADVSDHEVEEPRRADLFVAMVGRDEEVRGERHRLPRHQEGIRVVGQDHHHHGRDEHVVLEAGEAGRRRTPRPEVARRRERDASDGEAKQEQEERGETVEPQMERKVRQAEGQHQGDWVGAESGAGEPGDQRAAQRRGGIDKPHAVPVSAQSDTDRAEGEPERDDSEDAGERRLKELAHRDASGSTIR